MAKRKFAAFILTHGRPNTVETYKTIREHGYTGDIVFVVDNEDSTLDEYRQQYPDERFYVFDKLRMSKTTDTAAPLNAPRLAIVYARNACFEIAKELGYTHFVQFDDDYNAFSHTGNIDCGERGIPTNELDAIFETVCKFLDNAPSVSSIAFAQGGDFIGGQTTEAYNSLITRRKAMNSWFCRTDRPIVFRGRLNEDVITYVTATTGQIFLTTPAIRLNQRQVGAAAGGMSGIYSAHGMYIKACHAVVFAPSSVRIGILRDRYARIHHSITWNLAVPKIIRESHKKQLR